MHNRFFVFVSMSNYYKHAQRSKLKYNNHYYCLTQHTHTHTYIHSMRAYLVLYDVISINIFPQQRVSH